MGSEIPQLHVFFFPFMAHGHMIPTVDMAKLSGTRGVKTSIITTPANAPLGLEAGLPEGCENVDATKNGDATKSMEMTIKIFKATAMLQEPLDRAAPKRMPVLDGTSFFCLSTSACMAMYEPHKQVSSDSELFVVSDLPGDIKLRRNQLPDFMISNEETDFTKLLKDSIKAELKSISVVVNSFYELEPAFADYYSNVLGRQAWHIGPFSLCNRNLEDKASRGKQASLDETECLK
ncbi:hypothetical protein Dsin_027153 [Dipteronia sinensis]|uniref:Uncharacterized protein n=1 Tax=Dipteronia sinensis TaxID=43782 RepID=A0AAE0DYQ0_9ROSI|nr:hypothetical protein Dsin_027153 [Dipteronia sinensis]